MLRLSKKLLFAIEAVVDIAYHAGPGPVRSTDISRRQGIPRRYLEQVLQELVRKGVLSGQRGPRGGYRLARERRRITVGEIQVDVVSFKDRDISVAELTRRWRDKVGEIPGALELSFSSTILEAGAAIEVELRGPDLARRLREKWPDLRVLFVSGWQDPNRTRLPELDEVTRFLQKPFDPEKLIAEVGEMLAG